MKTDTLSEVTSNTRPNRPIGTGQGSGHSMTMPTPLRRLTTSEKENLAPFS